MDFGLDWIGLDWIDAYIHACIHDEVESRDGVWIQIEIVHRVTHDLGQRCLYSEQARNKYHKPTNSAQRTVRFKKSCSVTIPTYP
jgi:hypothetical protein